MDVATKYRIVEKIIKLNDDNLLNEIKDLLDIPEEDFWAELPAEIKQAINIAEEELNRGDGIPHEQVMAEIKNRFLSK